MDALRLALAGVRARRGVSLALLLVAVAAVAAAAAGPLYLRAGQQSLLRDAVRAAPVQATGIEVERTARRVPGTLADLQRDVARATAGLPGYPRAIGSVERDVRVVDAGGGPVAAGRLVARDGACDHVVLLRGTCPSAAGEVALSASAARTLGADVGSSLALTGDYGAPSGSLTGRVVAVWEARDTADPYWFDRDYFVALRGLSNGTAVDALLTTEGTFAALPAETPSSGRRGVSTRTAALVDLPVAADRVGLADLPELRRRLAALPDLLDGGQPGATRTTAYLPFTLATAERAGADLRRPVVLVTGQLLVLAWFVLSSVVAGATSARSLEVALAKLRGFSPAATIGFALLETVLVLLAAVPLGLLAGGAAVDLLAREALGPSVPVDLTGATLAAAGAALAGALLASVLAAVRVVRRPVLLLLRRTGEGVRSPAGSAARLALLVGAAAALLPLLRRGDGPPSTAALLAPGLVAVVAALLATAALPRLCRAAFGWTRRAQRPAAFLAVRQVARRPSGLRVVLVLATAFGLAVFAVVGDSVFRANRADRALAETGAARVLSVDASAADRLLDLVRAADPGGRSAMAVVTYDGGSRSPLRLVAVDSTRLAQVPYGRADLSDRPLPEVAARLRDASPGQAVPAAVTDDAVAAVSGDLVAPGLDGADLPLAPVARLAFVPRFGPRAVLADLAVVQARTTRPVAAARAEVWLAPGSAAVVDRLEAAGLRVDRSELAATRAERFGRQAPSLALQLFLAGAGAAALLALGGTVLELFLLGRRRAFEVAALAAAGLRRRTLLVGVLLEQLLLVGTGVLVGAVAGVVAVRLTLPVLPQYTDRPSFPRTVLTADVSFVAGLVGAVVVVLVAGVALSAQLLVRSAGPGRLREAQP